MSRKRRRVVWLWMQQRYGGRDEILRGVEEKGGPCPCSERLMMIGCVIVVSGGLSDG